MTNELTKEEQRPRAVLEPFLLLLAPFAPHLAEELWSLLGHPLTLTYEPWPKFEEKYLVEDEITLIVQANGKMKGKLTISATLPAGEYEATVRQHPDFEKWLGGKALKKVIAVPGKLVNLVVG
jgi:leucyl-tRNA synthetase